MRHICPFALLLLAGCSSSASAPLSPDGAAQASDTPTGDADSGPRDDGVESGASSQDGGRKGDGGAESGSAQNPWERPPSLPEPNPNSDTLRALAARHGLYIGGMVDTLNGSGWSDPTVQSIEGTEFNLMEPGNEIKWWMVHPSEDTFDFAAADGLVDFAVAHDMKVRGHNLLWGMGNPAWLGNSGASGYTAFTGPQLETLLVRHIQTVIGHFRDKYPGVVRWWDVTNEVMGWNNAFNSDGILWTLIGTNPDRSDYLRVAFKTARAADPNAILCMNDWGNEGSIAARTQNMIAAVKALRGEGVPIDCVGMESHLDTSYPSYASALDVMKQYASMQVQVQVTEFDVKGPNSLDWNMASTAATNLLKACLDSPNCTAFNNWGISQKYLLHDMGASDSTMLLWDSDNQKSAEYSAIRMVLAP